MDVRDKDSFWGNCVKQKGHSCDVCQCTRLLTDKFCIDSGGKSPASRRADSLSMAFPGRLQPHTLSFSPQASCQGEEKPRKKLPSPRKKQPKRNVFGFADEDKENEGAGDAQMAMLLGSPLAGKRPSNSTAQGSATKKFMPFVSNENNGKTPSKFSVFGNSSAGSPFTARSNTPRKIIQPAILDFASRDSGFENSLSFDDRTKCPTDDDVFTRSGISFGDELTLNFNQIQNLQNSEKAMKDDMFGNETSFNLNNVNNLDGINREESTVPCGDMEDRNTEDFVKKLSYSSDFDFDTALHDLEHEFDTETSNISKYEIISTDSPHITSVQGNMFDENFEFGSPIGETETSKNFNNLKTIKKLPRKLPPRSETTRMLNFDSTVTSKFEFTPPAPKDVSQTSPKNAFQYFISNTVSKKTPRYESPKRTASAITSLSSGVKKMPRLDFSKGSNETSSPFNQSNYSSLDSSAREPPRRSKLFESLSTGSIESNECISEMEDSMIFDFETNENNGEMDTDVPSNLQSLITYDIKNDSQYFFPSHKTPRKQLQTQNYNENTPKRNSFEDALPVNEDSAISLENNTPHKLLLEQTEEKSDCDEADSFMLRRPIFRRAISLNQSNECAMDRVRLSLFSSPSSCGPKAFKRPEGVGGREFGAGGKKSRRGSQQLESYHAPIATRPTLMRAMSDNEATIKMALARSYSEPDLIGDFSVPFILPLTESGHMDLKAITSDTLAGLIEGRYSDTISSFKVIDCRYPYEYEGGHIVGALNLYTEQMVRGELMQQQADPEAAPTALKDKRSVLIFHCEFSRERGPKLCRSLRVMDRAIHHEQYPSLLHPEMYLLRGGYRHFHAAQAQHCRPRPGAYTPMLAPQHKESMKQHRYLSSN